MGTYVWIVIRGVFGIFVFLFSKPSDRGNGGSVCLSAWTGSYFFFLYRTWNGKGI